MIQPYLDFHPQLDPEAWAHERATLIGRVTLGPRANAWPGAVLRADDAPITIGADTNLQDNAVVHITGGISETVVGERVTVGHGAILHGCQVGDDALIGMGSIVMDNAVISPWSVVGAGALVPPGKRFPPGVLIVGSPAQVVRELNERERRWITHSWQTYVRLFRELRDGVPHPEAPDGES